ncbi:digeranylgeranylglyceryl phosphate synthase [Candidatus Mancarchaeum acidiphilum]|uniref:Digeranylgeranylglyceryl phosphate synthase n=1 Tax=Candidatus Mancarchaeum acidiphilum TaxID=1920749 RepID=A0A218NP43_9ARCH|nr:UbiA family prenyltransferase [Candidatus Mancarchaeum acidiphilum]ASI14194.1 digeranylgeranylglyceryl phosphate synthase [Candidatus Mancarchaeum acidiphilum]
MALKDYIKLTRAEHSLMLAIAVVAAELITAGKLPSWPIFIIALIPPILIGMASFSINDYFDVKVDKKNGKLKRPLVSGAILPKAAFNLSIALFVIGVAFSALINIYAFIISVIFAVLAFFYSYRLKETLLIGNIYIAFAMAIPFIYGNYIMSTSMNLNILLITLVILLSGVAREIHGMIRDKIGDIKERHSKNLVYYIGGRMSAVVASALYVSAVAISIAMFWIKKPFYMNIVYLIPILCVDITLMYVSAVYLKERISENEFTNTRNISLIAMSAAILIYLIAAVFQVYV